MNRYLEIEQRIREGLSAHEGFRYTRVMNQAAKVLLDLSLEYSDLDDFYRLIVLMPKAALGWDVSLLLAGSGAGTEAVLAASTLPERQAELIKGGQAGSRRLVFEPAREAGEYLFPLKNNGTIFEPDVEAPLEPVIGLMVVYPGRELDEVELLFLRRYCGVAAMSLAQRVLGQKNIQHINFIKSLSADIGHNVIVPNIFFKAYLRRLGGKIKRLEEIQQELEGLVEAPSEGRDARLGDLTAEMANANEGLREEFDHIQKHYENTSMFLETLFRQGHFETGRYVLKKRNCNFLRDVIGPQVDHYRRRLQERGVEIDLSAGGVPDRTMEAVVDVGLISQVYANLLSNAIKYTRPNHIDGRKFIAYGLESIPDAFGPGADGIKLNLFSSGRPLDLPDAQRIFEEGRRGSNVESEKGTGHGLFFVKEVVELHGGQVGCESTAMGNNFYFILPK
ncbi:MAG: HAMP domain-containing sensor histidine kinase [Pseudomonadota bacterium]